MSISATRRSLTFGLPLLLGLGATAARAANEVSLADVERRHGGRLGVFAIDTGSGRTLAHRADERFLMCSTFKGLLAAQVLARVDAGKEDPGRLVRYTEKDLVFTSPVTKAHVAEGAMPVGALCQAIVEVSDNTAAVLLMRSAGGPAGLTQFVRGLGDTVTRSDRYEPESNRYSGVLDTTTPRSIANSASKILLGNVLSPQSRAQLEKWMIACKPGLNRLRAALPADWVAADRPGTSVEEQTNDYAIVRPPGRAPLLIAAYYDAPALGMPAREAVLREVGAVFVRWTAARA
ncbi:class A beta-lactamase [Paraburkholderia fungorum]|uniref:Beta-lactamase n=1 Tax=Paraburkholderia fungorum TaxID=134537 RepID=A0AAJ3XKS5_9BURK|nr:class A beta-lactamase [Paraburkholderia fungorum]MBB4513862.1 beta-lactamase class A [Paraburkholderia fungorum]MBB5541670.1 beta-lactamase class A [Paraburkholderia fungorum]MBU7440175.1 class A beta-lactamase [Paraburkholderia fungorum]MDT8838564.1 class A beta-lactamase [Paraburkholderia fungorum]PNE53837.1 class A beta-lactamase [Paraburkholderia fungorum]